MPDGHARLLTVRSSETWRRVVRRRLMRGATTTPGLRPPESHRTLALPQLNTILDLHHDHRRNQ
jgi:hypothetical protein